MSDAEPLDPRTEVSTPGEAAQPATELLEPAWRDSQGHDEWCEADWHPGVARYAPCGCGQRASTGDYPDGKRDPE